MTIDGKVGQGDLLTNSAKIDATVRDTDTNLPTGLDEGDDSSYADTLPTGYIESKSVHAVNGQIVPSGTLPNLSAGDVVTWKVRYYAPSESFNNLRIQDNLPANVFDVSELSPTQTKPSAWIASPPAGTLPPAGYAQFGSGNTFSGTIDSALIIDGANNQVTFNVNDVTDPTETTGKYIEILFSVTVVDAQFAEELLLTNQATSFEQNSFGAEVSTTQIAKFIYSEPKLAITKGVIAHNSTDSDIEFTEGGNFSNSSTAGPVTFTAPGSTGARFDPNAGLITSDALATTPIDADLKNVDAGDVVTYAIVIENTGAARQGAFNVQVHDALPAGATLVGNLTVTDGTGAAVAFTGDLFDPNNPLELTDPSITQGAIGAYNATSGENIIIITYDVVMDGTVTAKQELSNTATLAHYTAFEGSNTTPTPMDRADPDLTDEARVLVEGVDVTKVLVDREIGTADGVTANEVRVGEEFTMKLRFSIPEGVQPNVVIKDQVRTGGVFDGFEILSAEISAFGSATEADPTPATQNMTSANGLTVGSTGTVNAAKNEVSFNLGNLTNVADGDESNDFIEVLVVARSVGSGPNESSRNDTLGNKASITNDGTQIGSAFASVRVAESNVQIAKTVSPETSAVGDSVDFTVTVTNPSATRDAAAYDMTLTDQIPAKITLTVGSVVVKLNGVDRTADFLTSGNTTGHTTVALSLDKLKPNDVLVITYSGTLDDTLESGEQITNTAQVNYDSLPGDDADDGEKNYVKSDPATVTIYKPGITKEVIATSLGDEDTSGSNLAVGETVTYAITITIPDGQSTNVVLTDVLPKSGVNQSGATLQYVSSSVHSVGSNLVGSNVNTATGSHSGGVVTFDFGDITNQDDSVTNADDQIVVHVTAKVTDLNVNQNNDLAKNVATLTTDLTSKSAHADATVVAPILNLTKGSTVTSGDAGDVVPYKATSTNSGGAPAYDIVITDSLSDAGLELPSPATGLTIKIFDGTTDVTPTGPDAPVLTSATATGIKAVIPRLDPGQRVEISYNGVITDAAKFASPVTNTAQIDRYDTLPDGDETDATGRVYDTNLPEASHTVTLPEATVTKVVLSSNDDNTSGSTLTIGEQVTYQLTIRVPEGQGNVVLTDALPSGLKAISAKVTDMGDAQSGNLQLNDTDADGDITLSDHQVVFDFGTVSVSGDDDSAARDTTITVTVTAQVEDIPGTTDAGESLENTATLTVRDPDDLTQKLQDDDEDTANVTFIEPKLTLVKDGPIAANPGETVDYTLTVTSDPTGGPAYDIKVEDLFGTPLLSLTGTPQFFIKANPNATEVALNPQPTVTPAGTPSGTGFTAIAPELEPGQVLVVKYQATLDSSASRAQSFPNTGTITYDTVPDGDPQTTDGRDYTTSDSYSVATVPYLTKEATGSSLTDTGDAEVNADNLDLNIGETVTFTLKLHLPEVEMKSVILTDTLPAGLEYVSHTVSTPTGITGADTPTLNQNGNDIELDFGAVTNASDGSIGPDDVITVTVVARVSNDSATSPVQGDTLTNNARLNVIAADDTVLDEATASDSVDIVEPNLVTTKTAPTAVNLDDEIPYTVTVTNDGKGPAYDVTITDDLSTQDLSLKPGSVVVKINNVTQNNLTINSSGSGFSFDLAKLMPDDEVTVTYIGVLGTGATPATAYDNTVDVTYDSLPGDNGNDRDSTSEASHTVHTGPDIEKSISETSDDTTGDDKHVGSTTDLSLGETVTYDLVLTLPEIKMDRVEITDTLPAGLKFVSASLEVGGLNDDGNGAAVYTLDTSNNGQIVTMVLNGSATNATEITNPSDGSVGADDKITIKVTAVADGTTAIKDGDTLTNTAGLVVTPQGQNALDQVTDSVAVEIVEPKITVQKGDKVAAAQGQTVPYTVTFTNTGTGPAHDVTLEDTLSNQYLSLVSGTVSVAVTDANNDPVTVSIATTEVAQGFETIIATLKPGEKVVVTYDALLDMNAPKAETFNNTATVSYDSVKSGSQPSGIDAQDRDYTAQDSHGVATVPHIEKNVVNTSVTETDDAQFDPNKPDVALGEIVTYHLDVYLPEDVTMENVVLTDTLPDGLEFVSAQVVHLGTDNSITSTTLEANALTSSDTNSVDPDITHSEVDGITTLNFGTMLNQRDDANDNTIGGNDFIRIEVKARVRANVAGSPQADGDELENSATITLDIEEGNNVTTTLSDTNTESVEVVVPELVTTKSVVAAHDRGDTVEYQFEVKNTGKGPAFDILIADALADQHLTLQSGSVKIYKNEQQVTYPLSGVTTGGTTDGFSFDPGTMLPGDKIVVTYKATLAANAPAASPFDNTVQVTYDTLPSDDADDGSLALSSSDTATTYSNPTLVKTIAETDNDDTGSDKHDNTIVDVSLGETITYHLTVTLPEMELGSVILTENLPEGLSFVSASIESSGITGVTLNTTQDANDPQKVTFDLGAVDNSGSDTTSGAADDQIVVAVKVKVIDAAAVDDGATLTNSATLEVEPVGGGSFDDQTDSVDVEVVEPDVSVEKSVSTGSAMLGDVVTYTLVIRNDSGATLPAYSNVVTDTLPTGIVVDGNIVISDPARAQVQPSDNTKLVVAIPRLEIGEEITITYDARIEYTAPVLTDLTNTVEVQSDRNPPGTGDFDPDSDTSNATVVADPIPDDDDDHDKHLPHLGIDDAQFIDVVTIDPIFSGRSEPGANVTINLYTDDGALANSHHVLADAGGHWIALFPRVSEDSLRDDFWKFYDRSLVFQRPVDLLDNQMRGDLGFTDDIRRGEYETPFSDQAYYISAEADRPTLVPTNGYDRHVQTHFTAAQNKGAFATHSYLNINDVFEDVAADAVDRLYRSSVDPNGMGMNRFNQAFLDTATAVTGTH